MIFFRNILLLLLCFCLTACGNPEGSTPSSESLNLKIINGKNANPASFPQLVELIFEHPNGSMSLCSGTILGSQHILTAGHCVTKPINSITVFSHHGNFAAESFALHPDYRIEHSLRAVFHDIAVIKTPPHNLPGLPIITSYPVEIESELMLLGYGVDERGSAGSLKIGNSKVKAVTDNHIFGPAFYGIGTNPCNGDSGGPALQTIVTDTGAHLTGIVGLVSSGTTGTCYDGDITYYINLQNPISINFLSQAVPDLVIR